MKYSCYVLTEQFFLQLVTNVLRWNVLSRCIVQSKLLLFVCNLTLLGYERVLEKRFGGPGKS